MYSLNLVISHVCVCVCGHFSMFSSFIEYVITSTLLFSKLFLVISDISIPILVPLSA